MSADLTTFEVTRVGSLATAKLDRAESELPTHCRPVQGNLVGQEPGTRRDSRP
ncbi:MAG: hypothetical protein GX621_00930 [Pirellulaceae bacterium]|nr:hypothetical protein [Pirellulaceae bacterium]